MFFGLLLRLLSKFACSEKYITPFSIFKYFSLSFYLINLKGRGKLSELFNTNITAHYIVTRKRPNKIVKIEVAAAAALCL